ncbi:MAG: diguanylate cyclase [Clostridia bacterium]|nr:diguanylate cyclase [Clostridia bacterium]
MNSIRTKSALLTVCGIVAAMVIATLLGVVALKNVGSSNSDEMLLLLCETGEKNLDFYFESVEQSVEMVSAYVESDLDGLEDEQLQAHLDRVSDIFRKLTYKTNGVLTYYYRIDPSVSTTARGFWYVNQDGEGFQEHEVTDITQYDTEDTSQLVWFTVPKATGEAILLPPYITDNLGARVISYNTPVYLDGRFVGVIGIEIDYSTMAEQVDNIRLYENGYAFINDAEGTIVYHPHMDVAELAESHPKVPNGLLNDEKFIRYTYDGVEKQAVWLPLQNGMRLNVTVPVSEINASWHQWIRQNIIVSAALLVVFILLTMHFTGNITRPLRELTEAAKEVNDGNYEVSLDNRGNDEVGILKRAFNQLIRHLKSYIRDLNDLAYGDALTAVRNKGAFDIYAKKLQEEVENSHEPIEYAVVFFDCNRLKAINDHYGHDKGDIYLKGACSLICQVFAHSPVFRIGGDEFAAILRKQEYAQRDELIALFDQRCYDIRAVAVSPWEKVDIARGMAVYEPDRDGSVEDVIRRADELMYENKRERKSVQ